VRRLDRDGRQKSDERLGPNFIRDRSRLSPDGDARRREEARLVHLALGQLPERSAWAVWWHCGLEWTQKTVADALGITQPAVSQLVEVAKQRLRDILGPQLGLPTTPPEENGRASCPRSP
jgi:RNA polymerase sigma factor (sigma-70 family)